MAETEKHWLVTFRDDAEMLEIRKQFGQDHLRYLQQNKDSILIAGGLRYEASSPFVGGAWVVLAESISKVETLVKSDPYYDAGHRKYEISFWGIAHNQMLKSEAA